MGESVTAQKLQTGRWEDRNVLFLLMLVFILSIHISFHISIHISINISIHLCINTINSVISSDTRHGGGSSPNFLEILTQNPDFEQTERRNPMDQTRGPSVQKNTSLR